jgi:TetR/AcrR family transcriptional regulator, transcriptional repressor for nem operon
VARPKEFVVEQALDAAIEVFREHGFEGTSAEMLVRALKIGRQSLYDTFGDKWQIYLSAVRRYAGAETRAHVLALRSGPHAIDGIRAMIDRVVADAGQSCLGVNSICEFGRSRPELAEIHDAAARAISTAAVTRVRVAARGGATAKDLRALGRLALRDLQ